MKTEYVPTPNYPRFHLTFPVTDLDEARRFCGDFLGCAEGRASADALEFKAFGDIGRLFAKQP